MINGGYIAVQVVRSGSYGRSVQAIYYIPINHQTTGATIYHLPHSAITGGGQPPAN